MYKVKRSKTYAQPGRRGNCPQPSTRIKPSQKNDYMELRSLGLLEKAGIKPGTLINQEYIRNTWGIDPRTLKLQQLGLKPVPITGDERAKVFLRPNKNLEAIDLGGDSKQ